MNSPNHPNWLNTLVLGSFFPRACASAFRQNWGLTLVLIILFPIAEWYGWGLLMAKGLKMLEPMAENAFKQMEHNLGGRSIVFENGELKIDAPWPIFLFKQRYADGNFIAVYDPEEKFPLETKGKFQFLVLEKTKYKTIGTKTSESENRSFDWPHLKKTWKWTGPEFTILINSNFQIFLEVMKWSLLVLLIFSGFFFWFFGGLLVKTMGPQRAEWTLGAAWKVAASAFIGPSVLIIASQFGLNWWLKGMVLWIPLYLVWCGVVGAYAARHPEIIDNGQ